jgi:acyl dehydratase
MIFDDTYGIEDTIESPHFNADLARKSGMPNAYDFGGQRTTWMTHMLTDWCGDDGFVTDISARIKRPNYIGDTLWLDGVVIGKRRTDEGDFVDLEVKGTNQRGEVVSEGTASVMLQAAGKLG